MEIVLGPPGTGKTTYLLEQMEGELDRGTLPERIGFVSFTRRATKEVQDRAKAKFNLKDKDLPFVKTLHSLCFRALGLNQSEVLEGKKLKELSKWIGHEISGYTSLEEGSTFGLMTGDRCMLMDNLARVRMIPLRQQYNEGDDNLPWNLMEHFSRGLAEFKREMGYKDYTDMLAEFVETDRQRRLDVLFVDEAQDSSMLQWRVVERLATGTRRVIVAGDDDQALYRWAGAAVEHFIAISETATVLNHSWRVPPEVQTVALKILKRIRLRRPKEWNPRDGQGAVKRISRLEDAGLDVNEDTLIMSRNTCFLKDDAMPVLQKAGILYEYREHLSVRAKLVQAVRYWEALRRGEEIPVEHVEQIYEMMRAGDGYERGHKKLPAWEERDQPVTIQDLHEAGGLKTDAVWHEALNRATPEERVYMQAALRSGQKLTERPNIRVSTIHGAKGAQADHVTLLTDMAKRTYKESESAPDDEARTWYVAATRAKQKLTIVNPQASWQRYYNL